MVASKRILALFVGSRRKQSACKFFLVFQQPTGSRCCVWLQYFIGTINDSRRHQSQHRCEVPRETAAPARYCDLDRMISQDERNIFLQHFMAVASFISQQQQLRSGCRTNAKELCSFVDLFESLLVLLVPLPEMLVVPLSNQIVDSEVNVLMSLVSFSVTVDPKQPDCWVYLACLMQRPWKRRSF
jgi:hypothetical protein